MSAQGRGGNDWAGWEEVELQLPWSTESYSQHVGGRNYFGLYRLLLLLTVGNS